VPELLVCSQVAPLLADHEQVPLEAVTLTLLLVLTAPKEVLLEDKVKLQGMAVKLATQV
jgi:hypothetical protein